MATREPKIKTGFSTSDELVNLQRNIKEHGFTISFIQVSLHILIFNQSEKLDVLVTIGESNPNCLCYIQTPPLLAVSQYTQIKTCDVYYDQELDFFGDK